MNIDFYQVPLLVVAVLILADGIIDLAGRRHAAWEWALREAPRLSFLTLAGGLMLVADQGQAEHIANVFTVVAALAVLFRRRTPPDAVNPLRLPEQTGGADRAPLQSRDRAVIR